MARKASFVARAREWKLANPEQAKLANKVSRQRNPETSRCAVRNYRAAKKVSGRHSKADIAEIMQMQKRRCAYCKTRLDEYHVDHINPISKGGPNVRTNLQILCPPCNCKKNAKDPIDHARSLGMLL